MCQKCHEESDDDYYGNSIAEKRQKAITSVVNRHPELQLEPEDITFRFAPKHKWRCLRINRIRTRPDTKFTFGRRWAPVMKGGPPLWGIAQAAFAETDKSYTETCEILDIDPNTQHKALFVSEEPPINPVQAQSHEEMHEFDSHITDLHAENE